MSDSIDINGKKLLPIKEAASTVDYSRDYITRLARERKIVATQIGRRWYVDVNSLKSYQEVSQLEQEIKKQQLSDERKRELVIKSKREEKRAVLHKRVSRRVPAIVMMVFVVALGIGAGAVLESHSRTTFVKLSQTANIKTGALVKLLDGDAQQFARQDFFSASKTIVPDFQPNVTTRDISADEGILLLPNIPQSSGEIQGYFSDPVTVVTDEDGNRNIVRVDEEGNQIGESIPYVIVPVNSNSP